MKYKIVELEEKTVAALTARTNNASPEMTGVIGGLWQKFYSPNCCPKLQNRADAYALGMYTDYADDENGDYTAAVGCAVITAEGLPDGFEVITVPKGKYAEFVIEGDMDTNAQLAALGALWQEIWQTGLNRSFICDFEEYRSADPQRADVHVFIGIKEETE